MDFSHNAKTQDYLARLKDFMREHIEPVEEQVYADTHKLNPTGDWKTWKMHPMMEPLKQKAREAGLWNLFLPDSELARLNDIRICSVS